MTEHNNLGRPLVFYLYFFITLENTLQRYGSTKPIENTSIYQCVGRDEEAIGDLVNKN
jgi:hypothetical protein